MINSKSTNNIQTDVYLNKLIIIKKLIGTQLIIATFAVLVIFVIVPNAGRGYLESPIYLLILIFFWVIIFTADSLPHILRIFRQEKLLNFNFNQEMIREKITVKETRENHYWLNENWFYTENVIVHSGYIKKIESTKEVLRIFGGSELENRTKITFETVDEEIESIVISNFMTPVFLQWIKDSKEIDFV